MCGGGGYILQKCSCARYKKSEETWQLTVVHDPTLIFYWKKNEKGYEGQYDYSVVNSYDTCNFSNGEGTIWLINYIYLKRENEHLNKANEKRLMSEWWIWVKAVLYIVLIITTFL